MKKFFFFVVFSFLFVNITESQTQDVLLKFKEGVNKAEQDSILSELKLQISEKLEPLNVLVCCVPQPSTIQSVQQKASEFEEIEYIEQNVTYHAVSQKSESVQKKIHFNLDELDQKTYKPNQILIKFRLRASGNQVQQFMITQQLEKIKYIERLGVYLFRVQDEKTMQQTIVACASSNIVDYVEPNYIVQAEKMPNDPKLSNQWGLHNQDDNDVDATEAWDVQTGDSDVLVGIVDTGIDYNHDDLRDNYWHNPGETGGGKKSNGLDDDQNGYIDDWRGWDFKNNGNNPMEDNGHGTLCAGIVAASGNNNKGITGISWNASLVGLKFLGQDGRGTVADASEAIIYAADNDIKILNNSWGGRDYSRTLEDAIQYAASRSVLFVAAAGNDDQDNDKNPHYPSNLELENILSVAASNDHDRKADFSNYGKESVDLAAPGKNILSTYNHNRYDYLSGTSMAAPFVTGAASLIKAEFPGISRSHLKIRILGGVDYLSNWQKAVLTGGRLNASKALSHSPIIALTTDHGNTKDQAGPYKISSHVIDNDSLKFVKLVYYINGATNGDTLNMALIADNQFRAGIPGQAFGTKVSYFVIAKDIQTNISRSRTFHFKVSKTGNGCCGGLALSTANQENKMLASSMVLANLFIVILPWWLLRRIYCKKEHKK